MAAIAAGALAANAQTETGTVYVVPVGADGSATLLADKTYEGQVPMAASEGGTGLHAAGVELDGGFIFYAMSDDASETTLYGRSSWAVNPAIVGLENPLSIAATVGRSFYSVAPGTYDISFYKLSGYNYCELALSSDPSTIVYPANIYLVSSNRDYLAIPGADGVYTADVVMPASFRVSYEPRYDMLAFIYGPDGAATLTDGEEMPLTLRSNTDAVISYAADGGLRTGDKVNVTVSIVPGSESLTVNKNHSTAITDAELASDAPAQYFDLGGRPLRGEPTAAGVYIVRRGTEVAKVAVNP